MKQSSTSLLFDSRELDVEARTCLSIVWELVMYNNANTFLLMLLSSKDWGSSTILAVYEGKTSKIFGQPAILPAVYLELHQSLRWHGQVTSLKLPCKEIVGRHIIVRIFNWHGEKFRLSELGPNYHAFRGAVSTLVFKP